MLVGRQDAGGGEGRCAHVVLITVPLSTITADDARLSIFSGKASSV